MRNWPTSDRIGIPLVVLVRAAGVANRKVSVVANMPMAMALPSADNHERRGGTVRSVTIAAELEHDLEYGLPLKAKARHVFVAGDLAQIVLDWSIDGTGPDGGHVHLEGSASDVVHRGPDGRWRYVIDNALGTAVRQPS